MRLIASDHLAQLQSNDSRSTIGSSYVPVNYLQLDLITDLCSYTGSRVSIGRNMTWSRFYESSQQRYANVATVT